MQCDQQLKVLIDAARAATTRYGEGVSEPKVAEVGPGRWLSVLAMRAAGVWIASFVGFFAGEQTFDIINGDGTFLSDIGHVAIGSTGTAIVTVLLPAVAGVARAMSSTPQPRLKLPNR
ncbi:MAG: hypothetical protein OXC29_13470 [Rhodococcus sp.]|nr:hypothetical protein [Rhodococcus sp. (in: high G+C Gram-positive bacteria)]